MSTIRRARISHYKEFDNGHVLFSYEDMDVEKAEEKARERSLKDPDNIYYVAFDNIMDSSSDLRWINGSSYHYSSVRLTADGPVIDLPEKDPLGLTDDDLKGLSTESDLTV